jgi:AraC family transcriptional regulator
MQRIRTIAGIIVSEAAYSPEVFIPPHEHAAAFFDLVVAGACEEVLSGQARARACSTLAFHPAGEVHSSRWLAPESRCFHIEIPRALLDRVRQHSPALEYPAHFSGGASVWLASRLHDEFQRMDDFSPLAIEGLTLELLAACARPDPGIADRKPPRWLLAACTLLHENFAEHLTLAAIAGSVGIHPAHLARVFRRFHGCTLGDYVRNLRIEYACSRLTSSESSLVEIALAAGFSDQSHFSNAFKRRMGVSPGAFKQFVSPRKSGSIECSPRART